MTVKADLDNQVGVFTLPAIDPAIGTPAEVGGDQAVAFADRPEVWALLKYLTTPEAGVSPGSSPAARSSRTRPRTWRSTRPSSAARSRSRSSMRRSSASTAVDAMPAAVGQGTFWTEPIKVLTGSQDVDTTLANIAASWPK